MPRKLLIVALLVLTVSLSVHPQEQSPQIDLLITNATIVTMDPQRRVLENGTIAIRGDEILSVNSIDPKTIQAKQTIDARSKLILPGFINGHTHVPMSLFRGLQR